MVTPEQLKLQQLIMLGKVQSSAFALDISRKDLVSDKQRWWVNKLITEAEQPAPTLEMSGIVSLFNTAKQHLKRPKVWLRATTKDNHDFDVHLKPKNDTIYVSDGQYQGRYYGKISPAGNFLAGRDFTPFVESALMDLLNAFAANPAEVAAKFGQLMGVCCFCGLTLSDERSVSVGYGPICADHYGLPWGIK